MSRRSIATPCPTSTTGTNLLMKSLDETTTTLNFTTAFDASFRNVKPRRKSRASVQFSIHEDQELEMSSRLAKPARRITGSFSQPPVVTECYNAPKETVQSHRKSSLRLSQAPKRLPSRLSIVPESDVKKPEVVQEEETKSFGSTINAARPLRRGTIYIPNDDTTMPTMYMGVFSPLKDFDTATEPTVNGIAAQMAVKRSQGRRISMIDAAPRRAPLHTTTRKIQETTTIHDRVGMNGGKENMPPGLSGCEQPMLDLSLIAHQSCTRSESISVPTQRPSNGKRLPRTSIYAPTTLMVERIKPRPCLAPNSVPVKKAWNAGSSSRSSDTIIEKPPNTARTVSRPITETARPITRVPSRFVVPKIHYEVPKVMHDVLVEDIDNPTLYEDNWLGHQEVAMTQLVNKLFTAARPDQTQDRPSRTLTQELLGLYGTKEFATLYSRIQASILYGALSVSRDILVQGQSIARDIGRKQQFIDLWTETYDLDALVAGLEVVVGRQCRSQAERTSNGSLPPRSPMKKLLCRFIDAYLLRNEDMQAHGVDQSRVKWSYQRTILRSLMLIKTLDMIKTSKSISFSTALFQTTSPIKSSVTVVHALFQLLNPAAGDPVRPLSHIDYTVSHVQYPLEEFQYTIDNLAIDLRDGVRLTRLVELLLYPSASHALNTISEGDATTTIIMPDGDSVEFQDGQDWPLSQHLKFPCQSRVAKLWNVQIALSAVARVKGMKTMVEGISAEDIVDGFREKTIRLLWALVGKCGLASIINWDDVEWETRRLELRSIESTNSVADNFHDDDDNDEELSHQRSFESCKGLLRRWTRAVAASQGIEVRNFTTSFADGRVFEAIVDTYEPYLATTSTTTPSNSNSSIRKKSLSDRLAGLGCSRQFVELFSTSDTRHIFDRDFVLATLAFLCSRLLTPSRSVRAASVIQSAWRVHWAKVEKKRNVTRKIVATACAYFVISKGISSLKGATCLEAQIHQVHENKEIKAMDVEDVVLQSPMSDGGGDIWLSL